MILDATVGITVPVIQASPCIEPPMHPNKDVLCKNGVMKKYSNMIEVQEDKDHGMRE